MLSGNEQQAKKNRPKMKQPTITYGFPAILHVPRALQGLIEVLQNKEQPHIHEDEVWKLEILDCGQAP